MITDVAKWLAESAHPLAGLKPGPTYADLLPLKPVFQDKRIVGLGEATHGASEFSTMKHRLVQFLVTELGFTVLAVEASLAASRALNRYVLHGLGDPRSLLRELGFWTWNTLEALELVEWLRAHNAGVSPQRRVQFAGFDVQGGQGAAQDLLSFLSLVAPEYSRELEPLLRCAMSDLTPGYTAGPADLQHKQQVLAALWAIVGYLDLHRSRFAETTAVEAVDEALTLARNLARCYDTYARPWVNRTEKRDAYMADTIYEQRPRVETKPGSLSGRTTVTCRHRALVDILRWGPISGGGCATSTTWPALRSTAGVSGQRPAPEARLPPSPSARHLRSFLRGTVRKLAWETLLSSWVGRVEARLWNRGLPGRSLCGTPVLLCLSRIQRLRARYFWTATTPLSM